MVALPLPRRGRPKAEGSPIGLPSAVAATTVVQVAASLVLSTLNRQSLQDFVVDLAAASVVAALTCSLVGALIVRRQPAHVVGWLFCVAGLGNAFFAWTAQYARYALLTEPGSLPGGDPAFWLNLWAWVPVQAALLIGLPLLFPTGRLPSARWRPVAWLSVASTLVLSIALAFGPNTDSFLRDLENPYRLPIASGVFAALRAVAIAGLLCGLIGAVASLVARYRSAAGVARAQLQWFGLGAVALIIGFATASGLFLAGVGSEDAVPSAVILTLCFPLLPAATGVAILKHRLFDVEQLINRILVYGLLTACVIAMYVGVVGYLSAAFRSRGSLLASLVATGVAAVLFAPLRDRLQRAINRLMYGERDDPYGVLSRLGRRLEATLDPAAALPVLVETVRVALNLPYAAITLGQAGERQVVTASGEPQAAVLRLPLAYGGVQIGELVLAPRAPDEPFSTADRRLLEELARQAGVAAHTTQLTADLERSRRRIVEAREEARRRLGSDLHDGLGHRLAALMRRAEAASNMIDQDPPAARRALSDLTRQIQQVVGEVRGLAHALHPPELDLLGLAGALRERSGYDAGVHVIVDVPEALPALPVAVEAATYYIALEALANVHRHAGATSCQLRLALTGAIDPALELEIVDNGRGLAPGVDGRGLGLRSMAERAAELGGEFMVGDGPEGGLRVWARLPIGNAVPGLPPAAGQPVPNGEAL